MHQLFEKFRPGRAVALMVWLAGGLLPTGCGRAGAASEEVLPVGDPARGKVALQTYGCTTCHTIPGIRGANALIGPTSQPYSSLRVTHVMAD